MIALAGNKVDLAENRAVSTEEAKAYADENGNLFMETSGAIDSFVFASLSSSLLALLYYCSH